MEKSLTRWYSLVSLLVNHLCAANELWALASGARAPWWGIFSGFEISNRDLFCLESIYGENDGAAELDFCIERSSCALVKHSCLRDECYPLHRYVSTFSLTLYKKRYGGYSDGIMPCYSWLRPYYSVCCLRTLCKLLEPTRFADGHLPGSGRLSPASALEQSNTPTRR